MAALIYQIVWIRPLQFIFGSTVYTVSIIFGAFMLGLALGSFFIGKKIDEIKNLPFAYALLEMGIGLYGVLLLSIFNLLPKIYNSLYFLHLDFYIFEIMKFLVVFLVLLIPTTLMGATFPVITKFYTREKVGKGVGEVYSANNVGAILGSFAAGFILIPVIGIKGSVIFAGSINLLVASAILLKIDKKFANKAVPFTLLLFFILVYFGNYNIQQMHSGGFYKTNPDIEKLGDVVYYSEGVYSTVTVRELTKEKLIKEKAKVLFINGIGQGGTEIYDLRVNFLLAYIPDLIKSEIDNALVVGLGTGMTSGQLAQFTKVTTVEIEPKVVEASKHFELFNLNLMNNPNNSLIMGDARNFLLKNDKKYDVIISEPTSIWQSFSSQLYSKEFLEIAGDDLKDDGLFVKWVPIYSMSVEDFRNFYKTFSSVFPNVAAFANIKPEENTPVKFGTSEILLIGSKSEIVFDREKFKENYGSLPEISKSYLDAISLSSGEEVYQLFLFNDMDLRGYANDAEIVADDNLLLEFSTAKNILDSNSEKIIDDLNKFLGVYG